MNLRNCSQWLVTLLFGATLGACGNSVSKSSVEFADAAPDASALTLDAEGSQVAPTRDAAGGAPTIAGTTKTVVEQLNAAVKAALQNVDALIATEPAETNGEVRTWTVTKDEVDYKLQVKRFAAKNFGWKLQAKKHADSEFKLIMGGRMKRDVEAGPRRGAGEIRIHLTHLNEVTAGTAAPVAATGKLFAAFRHNKAGAHLLFRLKDYKADAASADLAQSFYFSGFRVFPRAVGARQIPAISWVRAGGVSNVERFAETAAPDKNETVVVRLRRFVGIGGWGRAVIFGGNMAENQALLVRECWNSPVTGTEAVYHRETWRCERPISDNTASCEFVGDYSYPTSLPAATTDPEGLPTKQRFMANCFEGALQARLGSLLTAEPGLSDNPEAADEADENAPTDDQGDSAALTPPVDTADANSISTSVEVSADF